MKLSAQLYPELEKERFLKWMIVLSFGLHVVLFASVLFLPGFQPRREPFVPTYTVDLVSIAGIQGKLPGSKTSAPKRIKTIVPLTKARKIAVSAAPEPVSVQKQEPVPILKPSNVRKSKAKPPPPARNVDDAVNKIRMAKQARPVAKEEPREQQKQLEKALQEVSSRVQARSETSVDEGLEGLEGEGSGAAAAVHTGLRLQIYKTNIWNKVRSNWSYPDIMSGRFSPEALVKVKVQRDGSIVDFRLARPSGNQLFDQSVLRAVQHSNPFPPFPEGYVKSYEEIELRFSLADLRRG